VAEFAVDSAETAIYREVTLCLEWTWEPCHGLSGQSPSLPRRRPGFKPRPVHVGFMMDRVSRGHVSLRARPVSPPIPRTYSFIYFRRYVSLAIDRVFT
jgi:hypothetical protein